MTKIMKTLMALPIVFALISVHAAFAGQIVEWAPYQTLEGVTDEQLLEASHNLQTEFLEKQKGYIKRELLKGNQNNWVDLVHWESGEDADRAAVAASKSPICMEYFGLMVEVNHSDPTQGVFRFSQQSTWE